jgi:ParB-like chromosome segregation protein Spo0J
MNALDQPISEVSVKIDNEDMKQMAESISENGVLVPTLVRPKENGNIYMCYRFYVSSATLEITMTISCH